MNRSYQIAEAKQHSLLLLELYNSGMNTVELANFLGITRERIRQKLEKSGGYKRFVMQKETDEEKKAKRMKSRIDKFWGNVDMSCGEDKCWNWKGCRFPTGYGRSTVFKKNEYAHRTAFILSKGNIPDGLCVCHKCDNPSCCNPMHLWLGTDADNMHDRDAKGRNNKGRKIPRIGQIIKRAALDAGDKA